jgi:glycosyltransferase involved in cell wall biosynthesis
MRKPIRVLIVAPSLRILGGQAVSAAQLMDGLRGEEGILPEFLTVNPRLPGVLSVLQSIKYVRTIATSLVYFGSLLLRVRSFQVVHVFSASYWSFLLAPVPALLVARLYGVPSLLNYRSGEAEDHLANWPSALRFLKFADERVVCTRYLAEVFGRFGLSTYIIPNTLDLRKFAFRRRDPLRPMFLSNRNLEPLYNVACTLRAFALIQKRYPEAQLMVAGDGSQRRVLEQLASELALRNVHFLGRLAPEQMREAYDESEILLNSPDIDNMPNTILEAWARGLPVATTDAGGIPYLVSPGKTALMVPCGDAEALAQAACRYLDEPALAQQIIAQARTTVEQYTWTAIAPQWLELYKSMAVPRGE